MEALPIFPMMAPAFRTSTLSYDNIPNFNFRLKMKEHILLTFNTDPHEYDGAFDELAHLKFEANIPSASVEQICKLKRYYGQLCMMQKRFPMGAGDQLETPFTWNDGLVDLRSSHSEVTINDIEFEKASVMFNIGACHAQFATEQTRDTQDSIKAAFMHFQYAAFAFEQLNTFRNCEMFYPSVDLDSNVIAFYYKVMIAQAQECLVQKSLLDNRSAIVIAKLSLWLQESFESATKIVDDWIVNIPESVQKYYEKFCRLKADMYGVIAYMSLGDHAEKEEKKMGWRLQYYNIAAKYMESVSMDRKTKENYPELMVTASFLFDVISAKQKNAEKENDFIYHDRVPKQEEAIDAAKKDGAMCKVKTLAFDPLDASVCGEDIFAALLPPEIIESNKNYGAQKAEILKRNVEVIQSYDANLDVMLERAEFDNLRFMLNEGKDLQAMFEIPDELMKRNADMTAYSDCIPNLIERLRESSGTATVADAKLNTLISKLSAIDLPRLKSDEGFILISKELNKLSEHLSQAKSNNTALNKAIASHTPNLQLLSLPCNEMWQKILPEWKAPKEMSPEEVQLRKMVEKVLEMRTQRHTLLAQIETTMKQDDISKKLMGTNEERANLIMQEELTKYAKYEQLINLNVQAQENIVRAFADANADFCAERIEMQRAKTAYDQKVAELIGSYDVYRDVTRKIEEGEQFYRQLMARCDQFAIPVHAMDEQYRAEIEKKERAQKEAEQRMHQFRMNREAQDAMMDFGGGGAAPPRAMGPISTRHSPMAPPAGPSAGRAPRLGDYLESYRARKGAQPPIVTPQFQPMHQQDEPQGPPSPTPSSICDFPVSTRGAGASQRMMASPRAPEPPSQYYGAYQPPAPYQQQHPQTNGAPPPLNLADPLNQIDVFGFANQK
uniref:BRO1 domain-containing protein n=1 Tax=Caenorhabditis japonica TaxID=281687 RepID=A0A8R1HZD7_CAEJA